MTIIDPHRIPIFVGATAVGKTRYSLDLAENMGYSILSADSMQVYKGMDIGTAKVSLQDRQRVQHYLVDIIAPDEPWNLHLFLEASKEHLNSDRKVMVVGGTGLYIRALIEGFDLPASGTSPAVRERLQQRATVEGLLSLHQELQVRDPESAIAIKPTDSGRIIRALEIMENTGEKASIAKRRSSIIDRFQLVVLNRPRDVLYQRIEERVEAMIKQGLVEEVKGLLAAGYDPALSSLQALGYKEIIAHLNGLMDWESTVELIKKRTRNFAKRQLTWYRSFKDAVWVEL